MKIFFLINVLLTFQLYSQCTIELDESSIIENDIRESTISTVSSLYNNNFRTGSFYNSIDGTSLFDLGYIRNIWAASVDSTGDFRLSANDFPSDGNSDYGAGPITDDPEDQENFCSFYKRIWTISGDQVRKLQTDFETGVLDETAIPVDILEWPAKGNPRLGEFSPSEDMAPFSDKNGDGIYDPLSGDFPIVLFESEEFVPMQFRFHVFNDNVLHTNNASPPLMLEFHVLDFVISCSGNDIESDKAIFTRVKYINKGNEDLTDLKLSIFDDTDLGCYRDDLVGYSEELNCNYVYNPSGLDGFQNSCDGYTPVPEDYVSVRSLIFMNSDLESFIFMSNPNSNNPFVQSNLPTTRWHYLRYMSGLWLDGTPMSRGGTGYNQGATDTVKFAFPDYPNKMGGWSLEQENRPNIDRSTVSTFADWEVFSSGQIGTIDFIDHVLLEDGSLGLDVFDGLYQGKVNQVREEYIRMLEGNFDCRTTGVDRLSLDKEFELSPNPTNQELSIHFIESTTGSLSIHSVNGRKVLEQKIKDVNSYKLDIIDIESGFYVLSVQDSEGNHFSKYFIKE